MKNENVETRVFDATQNSNFHSYGKNEIVKNPWTFEIIYPCGYIEVYKHKNNSVCGYETKEKAEEALDKFLSDETKYIYVVQKMLILLKAGVQCLLINCFKMPVQPSII